MFYLLYNILLLLASPVIVLVLLAKKRCRRGLSQRLGLFGLSGSSGLFGLQPNEPEKQNKPDKPVLWVHAVSLGEVVAAAPLIQALHTRYPHDRIVVSTVTETGREAVEQRLGGVAEHCYAPLDFPWVATTFIERLNPRAFLFVETELWPNLLRALATRGVPAVLINGRISTDSFRGYRLIRPFMAQVLGCVTRCLMQSERDVDRLIALGADSSRVVRTGNVKFDQPLPDQDSAVGGLSPRALGLADQEELLVAGSTHPVEEEHLLSCYEALQRTFPSLVLLLAPRHIERASQVEAVVKARGLAVQRRSAPTPPSPACGGGQGRGRVILLDTRGELAAVYRHAVLAFVGGTLVPVGGHNLLEPAFWGRPVLFGPHTDHCQEMADLLVESGGGRQVRDEQELTASMTELLRNRMLLQQVGQAARAVVLNNRGAVQRSLELIADVLDHPTPSPAPRVPASWSSGLWLALSVPYGLVVRARAALYRSGWLPQQRLPCRVVSVGNLTVGGTGKTPIVIALVERLLASGWRVGVLSRGYRRLSREPLLLVSDGRTVLAGPAEAGDEPYLIARRCPGAVVAVGADRYRLGRWVLERHPVDCFVLDDGFQHLALHRDEDLLLVDVSDWRGLHALLPAGRLREPLSAAVRATALLLTRADSGNPQGVIARLDVATGRVTRPILSRFRTEVFVDIATGAIEHVERLSGRTAVAFSGIGNPASFRTLLDGLGLTVLDVVVFPDHHVYRDADLEAIRALARQCKAEIIVTTEKDAGKVAPLIQPGEQVWAVRLRVEILEGREQFEQLVLGQPRQAMALAEAHA